ncbi:MAG: hypothetical protein ABWX66_05345 [Lacisediminihabitans sp.]
MHDRSGSTDQQPRSRIFVVVIAALIGAQVVAWLAVAILRGSSIYLAIGNVSGSQLQMILFWGSVACLVALIFRSEIRYARNHLAGGVTLIILTTIGTIALALVATIAIQIVGFRTYSTFALESSGDTYIIESARSLIEGGGPRVTVHRSFGPFFESKAVAVDRLGSGFSPFDDNDYFVMERGDEVTIYFPQYVGGRKDRELTFTTEG